MAKKMSKRLKKAAPDMGSTKAKYLVHYRARRFEQALEVVVGLIRRGAAHPNIFADAAVACVYLGRWQDAVSYAGRALALDPSNLPAADAAAHAHGALKHWDEAAIYGRKALELRDGLVPHEQPVKLPLAELPQEAKRDVIAFSLFGGNSKYCETAILNCAEQPRIYPDWLCRFYVDHTVPDVVAKRITAAGGEVIVVGADVAAWPGPMWRFAAYDAPDVRRVIFRDADSVISTREAGAVKEWIEGDTDFHAMRDIGTHTELLLAGLWGVKKGALPLMADLVAEFLKTPVDDAHFADQYFLRAYVWPYARNNLVQHDSVFGFLNGKPFPDGERPEGFHVGFAEGAMVMTITSEKPNGTALNGVLIDRRAETAQVICRYPGMVADGKVTAHIPARFGTLLQSGEMSIALDDMP
jgi:hypothetical protein